VPPPNSLNGYGQPPSSIDSLQFAGGALANLFVAVDGADAPVSADALAGWRRLAPLAARALAAARRMIRRDVPAENRARRAAGLAPLDLARAAA